MVEFQLQPLDSHLSKDCYVSVRIGEVQKLAKVQNIRQYKFPENVINGRKYGKLEIFKRVGGCTLGIMTDSDQEIAVPLDDLTKPRFKVSFSGSRAQTAPAKQEARAAPAPDKQSAKMQAAKDYLAKHNLEMRLSDAMQKVLKEQPDDPAAFISDSLVKSQDTVQFVPKEVPKASPAKPAPAANTGTSNVLPFSAYYAANVPMLKPSAFESLYSRFPKAAGPAAAPSSSPPPAKATPTATSNVLPVAAYCAANIPLLNPSAFESLYSRFPKAAEPAAAPSSSPPPAKATPTATSSVLPFAAYYAANVPLLNPSALESLYSRFPKAAAPAKTPAESAKAVPEATPVESKAAASSTAPPASDMFAVMNHRPSVATWLMCTRKGPPAARVARVEKKAQPAPAPEAEPAPAPATSSAEPSAAPAATVLASSMLSFDQYPDAAKNFSNRPSVATWLTKADRRIPSAQAVTKGGSTPLITSSQLLIGPTFYGMNLRPGVGII